MAGKTEEQPPPARKGMPAVRLGEEEYKRRFTSQFVDPAFALLATELDRIAAAAWDAYAHSRKSPRTAKAGEEFADPSYDLSANWIAARAAISGAQAMFEQAERPTRILIINGSPRSEHTCPGEMSKSWRLAEIARDVFQGAQDLETELLDLSRLASEYGRHIHPCKACFSTSPALCHWPCSCYPNYSLGQTQDWMNEIYPMWVVADGIMIVTPVHWYQASGPLKLMIDRLVCADGGNSDPTTTQGKDAAAAKRLEMAGWTYSKHLEGRLFSIVVHGDAEGAENLRRMLGDWLSAIGLASAGAPAQLDRYIGYYDRYSTSHDALDADAAMQDEVRNAAITLLEAVRSKRSGRLNQFGQRLRDPRPK